MTASNAILGASISGCPMLRCKTLTPLALACSEKATNFLIGETGISIPFFDNLGIFELKCKNAKKYYETQSLYSL